jgi:hypothetical protein
MITFVGMALAAWCYHQDQPPISFFTANEISVIVGTGSGNALTRTTPNSDGTFGVNLNQSLLLERSIKIAINTVNTLPAGFPRLTFGGYSATTPGPGTIFLASGTGAQYVAACFGGEACYANAIDPNPNATALIMFRPKTGNQWRTTPSDSATSSDIVGTLVHEILHTLGLRHSEAPGPFNNDCLTASGCRSVPEHAQLRTSIGRTIEAPSPAVA